MSHPDDGVLQELLDGELAPADEAAVRAHIAGCAPCTTALAELKSIQAEADTIVSRLDLDPPLPVRQVRPARANLRMLGLAASAVLVAGTSWILFRSRAASPLADTVDTGSGIVLPMPTEEREEVAATTPAAPLPAAADAPAEKKTLPVAPRADGSGFAAKPGAGKDEGSAARENAAKEKDVAEAARQVTTMAPPAAVARPTADAPTPAYTTIAGAEARLGSKVRTIAGLTPVSVEVLPQRADSLLAVRQRYVVSGVPVVLVQQVSTAVSYYMGDLKVQPEDRSSGGYVSGGLREAQPSIRTWEAWGSLFRLQGSLPADSLDALMQRVR